MQPKELLTMTRVKTRLVDFPAEEVENFVEKMFKFYSRSANYQTKKGTQFQLTFAEFLDLFDSNMLNSMARSFIKGSIEQRQRSDFAYVLTWKSRQDLLNGVMNASTAMVGTRKVSQHNCRYLPDEERDEKARKKMSDKKKGKPRLESVKKQISETKKGQTYDESHRRNISNGLKGKPKSAASNTKRSDAAKAMWAARKAQKEMQQ